MLVAVTGATRFFGRQVAVSLVAAGHQVQALDSRLSDDGCGDTLVVYLGNQEATRASLEGSDGIVHLAGYPRAGDDPPQEVFTTNRAILFAVSQAAFDLCVRLLVSISSVSDLGYSFYTKAITPECLPLDERAGTVPQDAYGLSKSVGEEIIAPAVQQSGGVFAGVRLRRSWLQSPESFWRDIPGAVHDGMDVRNLWAYLDIRDVASAVTTVFDGKKMGHTPLFISTDETFTESETAQRNAECFPSVEVRTQLLGNSSVDSTAVSRDYRGFTPQHSWRSYPRTGH